MRRRTKILLAFALLFFLTFFYRSDVLAQGSLSINNLSQSASSISLYDKLEITFDVDNSVATNLQWPCDTVQTYPTSGDGSLPTGVGISVDAVFENGGQTYRQPAFLYTPYNFNESSDFYHPSGDSYWMVRFAPEKTGNWTYHIEARDGASCSRFVQSSNYSFNVAGAQSDNHGFVKVSKTDPRYFEFSDGTPFVGVGYANNADGDIEEIRSNFSTLNQNRINFIRIWMDQALIWGRGIHQWDAWYGADSRRSGSQSYGLGDLSIQLANGQSISQTDSGQYHNSDLEANTSYKVRVRAMLQNVSGASGNGLVIQIPGNTNVSFTGNDSSWKVYEGQFTNSTRRSLDGLSISLQNAGSSAVAYIDEIYIGVINSSAAASLNDLSLGLGPNVVFKGRMNYQNYFDEVASQKWDRVIDLAEEYGVYLKLVISDMRDGVVQCINLNTGLFSSGGCDDYYFLSFRSTGGVGRNTKVRRLQEYFWRYLIARWGYATSVHSWELNNEGPPYSFEHNENADHLAEYMHANDPNQHMATTSYWSDFDADFYNDSSTDVDYADYHAYQSPNSGSGSNTGWLGGSQWNYLSNDAAEYHYQYAKSARNMLSANRWLPMVRGEGGITDNGSWNESELASIGNDRYGVWLHNFLWSWLNEYAAYEIYWWNTSISQNNLRFQYKPFRDFMGGVPINNGKYQALAPQISDSNVRIYGQKDNKGQTATHAVFWIQNKNHTWYNVVNNRVTGKLGGTVTIAGFKPNASYPVEWWDFAGTGAYTKRNSSVSSNSSGQITLDLSSYSASVYDVGVKLGDFASAPATPTTTSAPTSIPTSTSTPVPGDANGDGKVDGIDYVIWLNNYNTNTSSGPSKGDFNSNGVVDGVDYVVWLNHYGT